MKECLKCKKTLENTLFNKDPTRKDGLCPYCKNCKKTYAKPAKHIDKYLDRIGAGHWVCNCCGEDKANSEYHTGKYRLSSTCKICVARKEANKRNKMTPEEKKELYLSRKDYISRKHAEKHAGNKKLVMAAIGNKCVDCGLEPSETWPLDCFDFHHTNPDEKDNSIARLLDKSDITEALEEAKKCVVLCANCHRRRHKTT